MYSFDSLLSHLLLFKASHQIGILWHTQLFFLSTYDTGYRDDRARNVYIKGFMLDSEYPEVYKKRTWYPYVCVCKNTKTIQVVKGLNVSVTNWTVLWDRFTSKFMFKVSEPYNESIS